MGEALHDNLRIEDSTPDPEFLIKSISEQGYSLETAIADLIDNSISAKSHHVEILIDTEKTPFTLFLADDGLGMSEKELMVNMKFPSRSPDSFRGNQDLGRFGLGLKTASFSQTRRFTVLSRKKGEIRYSGRTWDVDYLRHEKKWHVLVNSEKEVNELLSRFNELTTGFLNKFENFEPNTIVIWEGLYKFESYWNEANRVKALKKEITDVTSEYLALVFHRFLENTAKMFKIRINNTVIKPFNPFPIQESDFRGLPFKQTDVESGVLKLEGFVLPSRSIDESKQGNSIWSTKNRGLMDLEGLYIYRSDRIILFGGWNGIIRKSPRLQLARLRVDVGNNIDHLIHLNVSKSQIKIPYELKNAFLRYISELKDEALKEYYNRGIRTISNVKKVQKDDIFVKVPTNKGVLLQVNKSFPLLETLYANLSNEHHPALNIFLRIINTTINKIRMVHNDSSFGANPEIEDVSEDELIAIVQNLKNGGIDPNEIKEVILPAMGYRLDTIPKQIIHILS